MTDVVCIACGSERVDREVRRVIDSRTGRATVPAGWYVCFDCWTCWDGVMDGNGVLPPNVKARGASDE